MWTITILVVLVIVAILAGLFRIELPPDDQYDGFFDPFDTFD